MAGSSNALVASGSIRAAACRARRKRLRLDAAARIAGHAVVEAGTHVEILGEHRWWPGTITGREEGSASGGWLANKVEYDGYLDAEP